MSDIESLSHLVSTLQNTVSDLVQSVTTVTEENVGLRADVELLKSVINRQAATIATLDMDIDNIGQYGRRENIVFTNLQVTPDQSPDKQVIELCKQIGVEVDVSDLVACHPLPARQGDNKRVIARFHDREKARKIFSNRKKTKGIKREVKEKLAAQKDKGFGILPNLTVKRNKFFAQVQDFCKNRDHEGCWVDPNTGKILLKIKGATRGRLIKNTADLIEIDSVFEPDEWFFCSRPYFNNHNDNSLPVNLSSLTVDEHFSPIQPVDRTLPSGVERFADREAPPHSHLVGSQAPHGGRGSSGARGAWVDNLEVSNIPPGSGAGNGTPRGRNGHRK